MESGPWQSGEVRELELPSEVMRSMVDQAMDRIVKHIESLPGQPVSDVSGGEALARSLVEAMPEQGTPFADLLDLLFERLIPKTFNTASPGYIAYIPGGGLFHAAVADLIADAVNRYTGVWMAAPALAQLEANVLRWFADIIGYPPQARGILTTGGSMANSTALVTARRSRLPENFLSGAIYLSDQVHHSVIKAALLAGFPERNLRLIPVSPDFRIRTDLLHEKIVADRRDGLTPFLIVASAGTTNTGAVDDLEGLADLAAVEKLWLHVDAAYGGFFMLTERGRKAMRGLDRADSVTLDPHKALFLPYGTGSLLVRDGETLRRSHTVHAEYLPPMQEDPDLVDFCLYSPELSRSFRGLRVWLPFKLHGVGPFRRILDEKLDLAEWAAAELRKIPGMEIVANPQLSLVAFRLARKGLSEHKVNDLNERLLEKVNARQRVFLTATSLAGRFVLRICVLSFRTHLDRMQAALEDIRSATDSL
ncbi:MAG: Aromatic-L-amino-acid decarboxylase [Acidobacteria bacterium]|nr:Aromatic-L-amino-acid decarboxylase [Acidobacteriota bacterium]